MKIIRIEKDALGILVELEGYPHAYPVFPADISDEDLKQGLLDWEIAQKQVDVLNKQKLESPTEPVVDRSHLIGVDVKKEK